LALSAIDAGITTLLDWSHIWGLPEHTDAVVRALEDSGLRAVFAYGLPRCGKWEERQPSWFVRAAPSTSPPKTRRSPSPWLLPDLNSPIVDWPAVQRRTSEARDLEKSGFKVPKI